MKTLQQKANISFGSFVIIMSTIITAPISAQTITTGVINGSPFCPGTTVLVPFTTTGTFGTTNVFKAQLSNSSGSFASGVTTIGSTTTGGLINGTIPTGANAGTLYRIRVISGSPSVIGSNNGTDLTVLATANCGANWTTTGNGNVNNGSWLGSINNSGFSFKTNNTQRAFLSSTGNFGIGTAAPTEKLEVAGNIRSTGSIYSSIAYHDNLKLGSTNIYKDSNNIMIEGYQPSILMNATAGHVILSPSATFFKSGNVGIGTNTPTRARLEITGSVGATVAMFGADKCGLSITANNPEIGFNTYYSAGSKSIKAGYGAKIGMSQGNGDIYIGNFDNYATNIADGSFSGYQEVMTIKQNGNIGVGVLSPFYKLEVCGTIRAKELKVETGWCDYVFDKNYKLRSIPELEKYIEEHKHLPGIKPAAEVEKEGLSVGEMNKAMMEKIEELTLYIIQLKKENDELNNKMNLLLKSNK